ncbi:MAG: hypothetical protein HOD85_15625 [Deltaproteobacteria bacterium]|nr:hypothetical protein [Deltaproteobacteria bacterium]
MSNNTVQNGHMVENFIDAIRKGQNIEHVPGLLMRIMQEEMWKRRYQERLKKEVEFNNFAEFITSMPPEGLGYKVETIKKLIRDDLVCLTMFRDLLKGKPGNPNMSKQGSEHPASKDYIISDNITNNTEQPRGTSRAYLLDRLKRDHPTKYQQVLDGKKSANKAAIEAGIKREMITVELNEAGFKRLWNRLSPEDQIKIKSKHL